MTIRASLRVSLVLVMLMVPAASAGARGPYLEITDVLDGSCLPEQVVVGQYVDCRFPLARDLPLDPDGGPYATEVDLGYPDSDDEQADCVVEGEYLVCRAVPTGFSPRRNDIRVRFGWGESSGVLATAETVAWSTAPVVFTAVSGVEPYAAPGRPLSMRVDAREADAVRARVYPRDGGEAVATLPVPPG